jgi:hypothetical protein
LKSQAQYLLRFDDLCPTMDGARWRMFLPLMERYGIKPILAVVPDNQDASLQADVADPKFWEQMSLLEAGGATIGLHGYQHVCVADGWSLMPLHRQTEFAGVPRDCQLAWVRAGLAILHGHGLDPKIWVAPRHGFDRVTLEVLREVGIGLVSDGFAERPYFDYGVTWIPQQLWMPVAKESGLWTICLHPNSATDETVRRLEDFVSRFAQQFTTVERVVKEWPVGERSFLDRFLQARRLFRIRISRMARRIR